MLFMQKKTPAFTFVELIIVLVIIAILATIGFVSYESYLSVGRDTAKISLMRDISTSFGTYWLKSQIPLPENKVNITASGSIFAYQWDFTEAIANTISFKWNPYDEVLDIYPTYMLLTNRKDTQILHFLEDQQSSQISLVDRTHAFTDYQVLYPKVLWKALWILIESETQQPIQTIESISGSWSYDVVNGGENLRVYLSQDEYYEDNISRIIPDKNCKRILELWGSKGSGVYTINPTGLNKVRVYCDMETEWGWWNVVVNNDNKDDESLNSSDCKPRLSWFADHACGSISESTDFVINAAGIEFNELVFSGYSWKFTNMNTYQYMKWDNVQIIPNTDTFESDIASSWDNEISSKKWMNDLRCWNWDPRYITLHNWAWTFEPHTAIQDVLSWTEREFSFIDDRNSGATINAYWLDDYQDWDGCNDDWWNKTYRGSSSYIMIR